MSSKSLIAAQRVGPALAERSQEIEEHGTLPNDLVEELVLLDAFRQWVPTGLGGPGATAWEGLTVIEEYAYHDGSTGWCVAIANTGSLLASFLPEPWAEAVFRDPKTITGGFAAPCGRAQPVEGGLLVSGDWQWGSGTRHCTWVGGGCLISDAEGNPQPREDGLVAPFVLFDPTDVEFDDNWDVSGLRGTGSVDYRVRNVFVPEGRWVQIGVDPPVLDGPIARFSFFGLLAAAVAASAVGIARRSLDELVAMARTKKPQGASRPLAERTPVQAELAEAEARLRAAWRLLEQVTDTAWAESQQGRPTDESRRSLRLASTHATQTAAATAETAYKLGGGAAIYRGSPLQRCFRDAFVATQHAMVAPRTFELAGRMRLGLDTNTAQL